MSPAPNPAIFTEISNKYRKQAEKYRKSPDSNTVLWLSGLSGSGKTTIATRLANTLKQSDYKTCVLDGDDIRRSLSADLNFSEAGRNENNKRVALLARDLAQHGLITIVSLISPFTKNRLEAMNVNHDISFIEIYCQATVKDCEKRDPKGHYKKARRGEIREFTGISSPYEIPADPAITLDTVNKAPEQCVSEVLDFLGKKLIIW